jgi:hypothetical protein
VATLADYRKWLREQQKGLPCISFVHVLCLNSIRSEKGEHHRHANASGGVAASKEARVKQSSSYK